jgi:very-short-patch-repair endonuclease
MDELSRPGWVDVVVAELASKQHGLVARRQLLALGIGRGAIDGRILRKRLHPVYHGVYALTPAPLERLARWMAAVLAAGEGAVLSHWSAASLWRMRPGVGPRCHVTTPRKRKRRATIAFHRADLKPDEIADEQGIPVTTPARTLLDLAPLLPSPVLARMVEAAPSRGASLAALLERHAGRAGLPKLRQIAATPQPMTRSDFEAIVLEAIDAAGLPRPQVNQVIEGYEVDFLWREHGVIAELDSYATHGSRAAFERDRERDRKLAIAGWTVARVTDEGAVEDLKRLLAATSAHSPRRLERAA